MTNQKKKRGPPPKGSRSTPPRTSPAFVTPMAAQVVKRRPEGDDWTYELKFDGYRALIIKDEQRVELRSRKNKDLTGMYPGIAGAGSRLKADLAVVDGEIVALDAQGSPSFQALEHLRWLGEFVMRVFVGGLLIVALTSAILLGGAPQPTSSYGRVS